MKRIPVDRMNQCIGPYKKLAKYYIKNIRFCEASWHKTLNKNIKSLIFLVFYGAKTLSFVSFVRLGCPLTLTRSFAPFALGEEPHARSGEERGMERVNGGGTHAHAQEPA